MSAGSGAPLATVVRFDDGVPCEPAWVPADDRGFAYGDGLFETVAVADGVPRLLDHHLERLELGARRLGFAVAVAQVRERLRLHARALGHGVLKYVVTRGSGPRGYAPPAQPVPRHLLYATPREAGFADRWWHGAEPVAVTVCRTELGMNPALAGIKHLNRLEQVLGRAEWQDPAVSEGLMRVHGGAFVCATAANLFALCGGTLVTPGLERAGVAGVMRRAVLDVAREGRWVVRHADLEARVLFEEADAVLLSSALTGLRRVDRVDDRALPPPAPDAQRRLEELRAALAARLGIARS